MDYFTKQRYSVILAKYGKETAVTADLLILPSYARQWLATLCGVTIAEDFQVLSSASIASQNTELTAIGNNFSLDWLVFAYLGQGDFWLLHKYRDEVGFYDHNEENYAPSSVNRLHIKVEEWLVVSDLFHQFDLLNEANSAAFNRDYTLKPDYKENFVNQIDSVSSGLFGRLPFTGF